MKILVLLAAISSVFVMPADGQVTNHLGAAPGYELGRLCAEYFDRRTPEGLRRIEEYLLGHPDDPAKTLHSLKIRPETIAMAVKLVGEAPAGAKWKQTLLVWFGFAKPTPELFQLLLRVALDKTETEETRVEARHQMMQRADESTFPIVAEMLSRLDNRRELVAAIRWCIGGKHPAIAEIGLNIHDWQHQRVKLDPGETERLKEMRQSLARLKQDLAGAGGAEARKAVALREAEKRLTTIIIGQEPIHEAEAFSKLRDFRRLPLLERLKLVCGMRNGGLGKNPEIRKLAEAQIWQEENVLVRQFLLEVIVAQMHKDDRIKYLRFAHEKELTESLRSAIAMMIELY